MEVVTHQMLKQPLLNEEKELSFENDQSDKLHFSIGTSDHGNTSAEGRNNKIIQQYQQQHDGFIEDSSSSSLSYVNPPSEAPVGIVLSATHQVQEIYLNKIYIMPPNHEFRCPRCNVCIEKVLFCRTRDETVDNSEEQEPNDGSGGIDGPPRCSACFTFLVQKGKEWIINLVPSSPEPTPDPQIPRNGKGWEIVKSLVYGGLAELLASLSVVTSAASADATTINIVALAIANLIGGLILLVHNLRDLKSTEPVEQESEKKAKVDKYYEVLGKREHFYLHAFVAIISFIIFGLLPPLVYGFSFHESDDKDLKLAALAVASLIGITLLAIAKAYSMRSNNNFVATFKTVFYYVFYGVLASLLTYVAGSMVKRLVEQLSWFEPGSNVGLSIPPISLENHERGTY